MNEKKAKKLLEHVKRTYDNIAEEFSDTRHYIGREFEHFLPHLKGGGRIVDLGCGNGRFAAFLDLKGVNAAYLGIDNSPKLLEIARKKYPGHYFLQGDQLELPLDDASADVIINTRAFHHIPSKKMRLQALAEMHRVLKPNGTLIITVWNLWQWKYWKQLTAAVLRAIFTLGSYAYNDTFIPWKKRAKRYYHAFTKRELRALVLNSGFTVLKQFEVGKDFVIIAKK